MPSAAGFMHWAPLALHFAVQRRALPEMTFGRGIDGFSYITSAEGRARRLLAQLFADLIKDIAILEQNMNINDA
jgi:hypothetical protein